MTLKEYPDDNLVNILNTVCSLVVVQDFLWHNVEEFNNICFDTKNRSQVPYALNLNNLT